LNLASRNPFATGARWIGERVSSTEGNVHFPAHGTGYIFV
jgi:hypothetical protein